MGACTSVDNANLPPSSERGTIRAVPAKISSNPVAATRPAVSVTEASVSIAYSIAVPTSESAYAIPAAISAAVVAEATGSGFAAAAALPSIESVPAPKKPLTAGGLPDTQRTPIVGEAVVLKEIQATVAWNFSSQLEKIYSK